MYIASVEYYDSVDVWQEHLGTVPDMSTSKLVKFIKTNLQDYENLARAGLGIDSEDEFESDIQSGKDDFDNDYVTLTFGCEDISASIFFSRVKPNPLFEEINRKLP